MTAVTIPDPVEAAHLRATYYGNIVIDLGEQALRAFGADLDVADAAQLLQMWANFPQLSPREASAILARFVPEHDDQPPAKVPAVANALHTLGCITRGNAEALLGLTVVGLSDAERTAVLAVFPDVDWAAGL